MLGKATAPPVSLPQRQRQDVFYCPAGYQSEFTLFHTSRVIKYVFLDGSQNIATSSHHSSPGFDSQLGYLESTKGYYYPLVIPDHSLASSYWAPELERLPIFVTLSKGQQKGGSSWGRPLYSWDRLPVFRQLCGEAVMAAPCKQENVVSPQITQDEPEKAEEPEAQGLENELEKEKEEEKEEEEEKEKKEEEAKEEEEEEETAGGREGETTP